ncbi:MAG: hypothetical protein KAS64_06310 [Spirochaetes bacterium]|nr:hypothetical protein [Spirochaetota bacterium]
MQRKGALIYSHLFNGLLLTIGSVVLFFVTELFTFWFWRNIIAAVILLSGISQLTEERKMPALLSMFTAFFIAIVVNVQYNKGIEYFLILLILMSGIFSLITGYRAFKTDE